MEIINIVAIARTTGPYRVFTNIKFWSSGAFATTIGLDGPR